MTKGKSAEGAQRVRYASTSVNESEGYCTIFTSANVAITEVRLYEETIEHVIEQHGEQFPVEFPSVIGAVAKAIQEPTAVTPSYRGSFVYVDSTTTNGSGHPLHVPVKAIEGTSGLVKTFFFAQAETDDGAKGGGDA